MFSKLKNFSKVFKSEFSHLLLIIFIGILCKITVLIPHTVHGNSLFGSQVVLENLKGTQVIADIVSSQILTDIGSIAPTGFDIGFQNIELIGKSISKFGSSFIKVLSIYEPGRKIIASEATDKNANDCKSATNQSYFVGSKNQFISAAFVGGIIGLIIGIGVLFLFFSILSGKSL